MDFNFQQKTYSIRNWMKKNEKRGEKKTHTQNVSALMPEKYVSKRNGKVILDSNAFVSVENYM